MSRVRTPHAKVYPFVQDYPTISVVGTSLNLKVCDALTCSIRVGFNARGVHTAAAGARFQAVSRPNTTVTLG